MDQSPARQPADTSATLYTIGEAADVLGVSIPTLRLYEREGLIIPRRKSSKHRRYALRDIERIRCIRKMINEEKVSIAGIRRLLSIIPCWTIKNCPADVRETCGAFTQHDKPCWMVSDRSWECRSEECRTCVVYAEIGSCEELKKTIARLTIVASAGQRTLTAGEIP